MRFDLYSLIHKAQRKYLFELSIAIGRVNLTDENQRKIIESKINELVTHIQEHSKNEETFIHPLFAEVGKENMLLEEEHHDTHKQLELLKALSAKGDMQALYSEFNRFVANYLQHTDEEERLQAEVLWENFDDQRLLAVMAQFSASKSQQETLSTLDMMAPALNIQELMKLFGPKPV